MFCPKCGTENQDDAKLCKSCNKELKTSIVGTITSMATGSVAGASSAFGGVIAGGSATATGAAALTSGLATVGSIVGGGMLAGIGVVAAAPIAGGALGYGVYRFYKHLATKNK